MKHGIYHSAPGRNGSKSDFLRTEKAISFQVDEMTGVCPIGRLGKFWFTCQKARHTSGVFPRAHQVFRWREALRAGV